MADLISLVNNRLRGHDEEPIRPVDALDSWGLVALADELRGAEEVRRKADFVTNLNALACRLRQYGTVEITVKE